MRKIVFAFILLSSFCVADILQEWCKVVSGTGQEYSIVLVVEEKIPDVFNRSLSQYDFEQIKAIRVRDSDYKLVNDSFSLIVAAQSALIAAEYNYHGERTIPSNYFEEYHLQDDETPFYIPKAQTSDTDYYKEIVSYGYLNQPDTFQLPSAEFATNVRRLAEAFKFGGVGLSPNLMNALYDEILWNIMIDESSVKDVDRKLLATFLVRASTATLTGLKDHLKGDLTAQIIGMARDGNLDLAKKYGATLVGINGLDSCIGWASDIKDLYDFKVTIDKNVRRRYDQILATSYYGPVLSSVLKYGTLQQGTLVDKNPQVALQLSKSMDYVFGVELPAYSENVGNLKNYMYAEQWDELTAQILTKCLTKTFEALGVPVVSSPLAEYINEGTYEAAKDATEAYYDPIRAALVLNIHKSISDWSNIAKLQSFVIEDGYVKLRAGHILGQLIILDKILGKHFFYYMHSYLSNNNILYGDFMFPNEAEKLFWKQGFERCKNSYIESDKNFGFGITNCYIDLLVKYLEEVPNDYFYPDSEQEEEIVYDVEVDPEASYSPSDGFNFGEIYADGVVEKRLKLFVNISNSMATWDASIIGDSAFSLEKTTGTYSNTGFSILTLKLDTLNYDAGEVPSAEIYIDSFDSVNNIINSLVIPAKANIGDRIDQFENEIPLELYVKSEVADGMYSTRRYPSGAWEDLGWSGESDTLAISDGGSDGKTFITSAIKFDISSLPKDVYITDVDLLVTVKSVNSNENVLQTGSILLFEHKYDFSDDLCSYQDYPKDVSNRLADIDIERSGTYRFGGTKLRELVRSWQSGSKSNKGLLLYPSNTISVDLYSSESSNIQNVPRLIISYQSPDSTKPSLTILTPRNGSRIEANKINIEGVTSDRHGINELLVNGSGVELGDSGNGGIEVAFNKEISLVPGKNILTVESVDDSIERNKKEREIVLYRPHFILTCDSEDIVLRQGGNVNIPFEVIGEYGYAADISIEVSGGDLSSALSAGRTSVGQTFELGITAKDNQIVGCYNVVIYAIGDDSINFSKMINVEVIDGYNPDIIIGSPSEDHLIFNDDTASLELSGSAFDIGTSGLQQVYLDGIRDCSNFSNLGTKNAWRFVPDIEPGMNIFSVNAVDNAGNITSKIITITRDALPQSAPIVNLPEVDAENIQTSDLQIAWNSVTGAERYNVVWGTSYNVVSEATVEDSAGVNLIVTAVAEHTITKLSPGTKYYYRVDSVNSIGLIRGDVRSFTTISESVNGYWKFDSTSIDEIVDVSGNGNSLELNNVVLSDAISGSGLLFSGSTQNLVLPINEASESYALGFWAYLPDNSIYIADLSFEVAITELAFNGTTMEEENYSSEYALSLKVVGSQYNLYCEGLGYSASLPKVSGEEWVFIELDLSVINNAIALSWYIYETDSWLEHTDTIAIDNGGNTNISSVIFEKWLDVSFFGNDTLIWILDELVLCDYNSNLADQIVTNMNDDTVFSYTFKIKDQYGNLIPYSELDIVELSSYNLTDGILMLDHNPSSVTLIPEAANYQFASERVSLPWNDSVIELVASNGPPVDVVVSGNGVSHVEEDIVLNVQASDIESEELEYQVAFDDGSLSDWFTGSSCSHRYSVTGEYYVKVRAKDSVGNMSTWSNPHRLTVLDRFTGNTVVLDNSNPVLGNTISSGTQIIIRPTDNPIELTSDLIVEDGAELIIDGGNLLMPATSTIYLNGNCRLMAVSGAILNIGNLVSDNLEDQEWWTNPNRSIIKLFNSDFCFHNFNVIAKSFEIDGGDIQTIAKDGITSGQDGESVIFSAKSIDTINLRGLVEINIKGGNAQKGLSSRDRGGHGGSATFKLYSFNDIIVEEVDSCYIEGGRGQEGGGYPSDSGNGGSVFVELVANGKCFINSDSFLERITGGDASEGKSDGDDEDGAKAGKPGDINLLIESLTDDIELKYLDIKAKCEDTESSGSSDEDSGADGIIGANSTVIIRAANDIHIDSASVDVVSGDGGDGGDGDHAGDAAAAGDSLLKLECQGDLYIAGSAFDVKSGDGGDGGSGEQNGANVGIGGNGGNITVNFKSKSFVSENTEYTVLTGDGGNSGDPRDDRGQIGGNSGVCSICIESDDLVFSGVDFNVYIGNGGDGGDGDDDNGARGGYASALNMDWDIIGDVELIETIIKLKGGDAGSTGDGETTVHSASGSKIVFNINSKSGSFTSINSLIKIEAGDGATGGCSEDNSSGGKGGSPGEAVFGCNMFGYIKILDSYNANGSLYIRGGEGGNGGRSKEGRAGVPFSGGHSLCSLVASQYIDVDKGVINVIGGKGGKGGSGDEDSDDSDGEKGGIGELIINSPEFILKESQIFATGGLGGNGRGKSAGSGGNSEISVQGDVFLDKSTFIAQQGQPGRNDNYVWGGEGSGQIDINGNLNAVNSVLGKKIFSSNADIVASMFAAFSTIDATISTAWEDKYPYSFLELISTVPDTAAHNYQLIYSADDMNWLMKIDGVEPESNSRVNFEENYNANGINFKMGSANYFQWQDGDAFSFSTRVPVVKIAADSTGTALVDQPVRIVPAYKSDYKLYNGQLEIWTITANGEMQNQSKYECPPYFASIPGWSVDSSSTITQLSGDGLKFIVVAPGLCTSIFNYIEGQDYQVALLSPDSDSDNISDEEEQSLGTDPMNSDTDNDGLSDWMEIFDPIYNMCDPLDADTDNDGVKDGLEISSNTDPTDSTSHGNRPPYIDRISITFDKRNLRIVSNIESTDLDSDPMIYEYSWLCNDVIVPVVGGNSVESIDIDNGDKWQVRVRAQSGNPAQYSDWVSSNELLLDISYEVRFIIDDTKSSYTGDIVQNIILGEPASEPVIIDKDGWVFTGWDSDFNEVTNDIVVTAQYVAYEDTDLDGLGDYWENDHFGNLSYDGTDDYDGDGRTNEQEETDRTDPTDAGSVLGLVAYYPFKGNANDESGNNNHGIIHGATKTHGVVGDAIQFDGIDDYVEISDDDSLNPTAQATVSFWVKIPDSIDHWGGIMEKGHNTQTSYSFGINSSYGLGISTVWPSEENKYSFAFDISLNSWHFVTFSFENGDARLYHNGKLLNYETERLLASVAGTLLFGVNAGGGDEYGKFALDEVRIYNRALTAEEIIRLYEGNMPQSKFEIITGDYTWHEARSDAESNGGHLATFTSEEEWLQVVADIGDNIGGEYCWIGATDENQEGVWEWITGESWRYVNWREGEPNNSGGNEHYCHTYGISRDHSWNDAPESSTNVGGYILELPKTSVKLYSGEHGVISEANYETDYVEYRYGNGFAAPEINVVPDENYIFVGFEPDLPDVIDSNFEATAQYAEAEYTVTFLAGSHGAITAGEAVQIITYGGSAFAPTVTSNEAYDFIGWDKEFNNITDDLTVTAQYQVKSYTVTFLSGNHGTITAGEPVQIITYGGSAFAPTVTSNEAHDFVGWDKAFNNITGNLTVTALYEIKSYTVTFLAGDHGTITNGEAIQTINYGGSAFAPTVTSNEAYDFIGWDKAFNNITGNLTVTAQYQIKSYTVTFLAGDHGTITAGEAVQTVNHGELAIAPSVAPDECYNFDGWNIDFSNIQSDLIAAAVYSLKTFTVRFDAGEHGTISGEQIQLIDCGGMPQAPTITADYGWIFTGWDVPFTTITQDLTVNAVFEKVKFTVVFNSGEHGSITNGDVSQAIEYGSSAIEPTVIPDTGYKLVGWDVDFSSVTDNLIVTAQYERLSYNVKFNIEGYGSIVSGDSEQIVYYGDAAVTPVIEMNECLIFTGWDKEFSFVTQDITVNVMYTMDLEGDGTESDPYKISTKSELEAINYDLSSHYILVNDIDLSQDVYLKAVIAPDYFIDEQDERKFTGVFDGNDYVIKNLTIDARRSCIGLFGMSRGSIFNVKLENVNIKGTDFLGSLCGILNGGQVSNCYVSGLLIGGHVIGGLCGYMENGGRIINCHSDISVTGEGYVGGLCGHMSHPSRIINSSSTGIVTGTSKVGGMCGYNHGGHIISCYSSCSVIGRDNSQCIGGLCGNNSHLISNCYSIGSVNVGKDSKYIGGFCGYCLGVENCYSTGNVTVGNNSIYVGAFIGMLSEYYDTGNCFWNFDISSQDIGYNSSGNFVITNITGKTTAEMQKLSTFIDVGWDFFNETDNGTDDYWRMYDYPVLSWQKIVTEILITGALQIEENSTNEYVCTAYYIDGSFEDITTEVDWEISDDVPVIIDSNDILVVGQVDGDTTFNLKATYRDLSDLETIIIKDISPNVSCSPNKGNIIIGENEEVWDEFLVTFENVKNASWRVISDSQCDWLDIIGIKKGLVNSGDSVTIKYQIDTSLLLRGSYSTSIIIQCDQLGTDIQYPITVLVEPRVGMVELYRLISFWLSDNCYLGEPCYEVDWYQDSVIDLYDYIQLINSWGRDSVEVIIGRVFDNFESGDFTSLPWLNYGNSQWVIDSSIHSNGTFSAKTGYISHDESSIIELSVNTGTTDTIRFDYKVSSEQDFDTLKFMIDGIVVQEFSGFIGWQTYQHDIVPGDHSFVWKYEKDSSWSDGEDSAWIDNVCTFSK